MEKLEAVTVQDVLSRLDGVRQTGSGWEARCPTHEDNRASLSVDDGDQGVVLKCHAGCETRDVVKAIGLEMCQLFRDQGETPKLHLNGNGKKRTLGRIVATYDYLDAEGNLVYQAVRYEPKDFRQRRPDGAGGWTWDMKGVQRVLYRLPRVRETVTAGRPVFLVEGEKDVHTLEAWRLCATTNAGGADKWDVSYERALMGARVVIVPDNDEAGRRHAQRIARALHGKAAEIRILELPGLPEKGDVSDWVAAGGTYDEFGRLVREAPIWTPPSDGTLPQILVNDRPLRDVAREALRALEVSNVPPTLFVRAGLLVRIQQDEKGRPIVQSISIAHTRGYLTRAADFVVAGKHGTRHESPPEHVVADVLAMGGWPMPALDTITETPVLRPDGSIVGTPGYDATTRMFYAPAGNLSFPPVPERPTAADVAAALELLDRVFGDFPYVDEASRANMLGLLLTPILRPLITGPTPLALIDAPQRGTGKSLLAELVSVVATGRLAAMMSAPDNNEEWRKSLTATFREAASVITIDNIEGLLSAAALAMALTAPVWKDRILGSSTTFEFPICCTWIATGNNVTPGGDVARRCYWIRIDAKMSRPWQRTAFRIKNVREWAFEHRGELVAALLTLCRYWFALGKPQAEVPVMGSFESWSKTVGNVLATAGVKGFLGNLDEMYDQVDTGDSQWEAFLTEWRELYADSPRRVAEIAAHLRSTVRWPGSAFTPDETYRPLRDAIPDDMKLDVEGSEDSLKKKLGWALKRKLGVRHGEQGLHLCRAEKDTHANVERWRVLTAAEATPVLL